MNKERISWGSPGLLFKRGTSLKFQLLAVLVLSAWISNADAQKRSPVDQLVMSARYETDFSGKDPSKVVRVWNLSPESRSEDTCHPYEFEGRIAAREFSSDGLMVVSIVFQDPNGSRFSINVHLQLNNLPRYQIANIVQGIQQLTRVGNRVSISEFSCGNGPVEYLDSIAYAH